MSLPSEPWGKLNFNNPHDLLVGALAGSYHYVVKARGRPWKTATALDGFPEQTFGVADVSLLTDQADILNALRCRTEFALDSASHSGGSHWEFFLSMGRGKDGSARQIAFIDQVQDIYIRHTFGASMVAKVNAVRAARRAK